MKSSDGIARSAPDTAARAHTPPRSRTSATSPLLTFEDRRSDFALIDRVWKSHSDRAGTFHSMASCNGGLVVSRVAGCVALTIRGPETRATVADCPADGEWIGMTFALGTFMPMLPGATLRDRNDASLPTLSRRSFLLDNGEWEFPSYENAETFARRLVAKGLLAVDPHVPDILAGEAARMSERTAQRRVMRATGLSPVLIRQIERARLAVLLLRTGRSIADVACETGYFDQAHLTRSLRRFVGQTPLQVAGETSQLSLLYNTSDS